VQTKLAKRLIEPEHWTCPLGHRVRPEPFLTYGPEVAELNAKLGFAPDPQQELGLDLIFGINPDGSPLTFEFCVVCCRQNLKTGLLKQTAIGWMFVTEEPEIVWSSHEMSTTRQAQTEIYELIAGHPATSRRLPPPRSLDDEPGLYLANGQERVELDDGKKTWFKARTNTGGRGLGKRKLILDEFFAVRARMLGSLIPILLAQHHPQVLYASSAGMAESDALREVRDRGRAGWSPRLTYLEWGGVREPCRDSAGRIDEDCRHPKDAVLRGLDCALDRESLLIRNNPTVTTGRITVQTLRDARQAMPPDEYPRECLGWWDDPDGLGLDELSMELWSDMDGATAEPLEPVAFGVTVYPDRGRAAIGVAGRRADGLAQVELVAEGRGVRWPVEWIASRVPIWQPCAVVLDGTALSLAPQFEELGIEVITTSSVQRAQAAVGLYDDFAGTRLRHPGERLLDRAVETSTRRAIGSSGFVWDGPDSGPLAAVSLAHWGLSVYGAQQKKAPPPAPAGISDDLYDTGGALSDAPDWNSIPL
jgi:hypothetical protein